MTNLTHVGAGNPIIIIIRRPAAVSATNLSNNRVIGIFQFGINFIPTPAGLGSVKRIKIIVVNTI